MTFVEAALEILSGKPGVSLHVEELCRIALERDLLSRPGKAPLRSMKARLTTELKRGDESRIERVGDHVWKLRGADEDDDELADDELAEEEDEFDGEDEEDEGDEEDEEDDDGEEFDDGEDEEEDEDEEDDDELADEEEEDEGEDKEERERRGANGEAREPAVEGRPLPEPRGGLDELLAPAGRPVRVVDAEGPDDDAAEEMYGDDLEGEDVDAGTAEYADGQTADEDRPMLPEISARKERHQKLREKRREDRERRRAERKERQSRRRERERERVEAAEVAQAELPDVPRYQLPGTAAGDAAVAALASIKGGQAVQVKQLAQMLRKRGQIDGDPGAQWPHVKALILRHERERAELGLGGQIEYRGRDLFKLAGTRTADPTLDALEQALVHQRAATRGVLADRVRSLSLDALEQVCHVLLVDSGWKDIDWVKRSGRSSYATAVQGDVPGEVLIGVRTGDDVVDRRGIGELRAGVGAKGLRSGLLLSPHPLSEDAVSELERGGAPLYLMVGDAFIDTLWRAGIGVRTQSIQVSAIDTDLFDELVS